jgi:predicted regulator of Ras-like GTPase activity (Roadblock/LC7/MglB family)
MNKLPRTAAAEKFSEQVEEIHGVGKFALVRNDGRIVIHNMPDPDEFASMITLCGRSAISLRKPLGVSHIKQIVCTRPSNQNIIIFQLHKYFLGIQQTSDTDQDIVIQEIRQLLRNVAQNRAH